MLTEPFLDQPSLDPTAILSSAPRVAETRESALAMDEFGWRVRAHRVRKRWALEQLAEEVAMHFTYVGGIERGRRNESLKQR